MSIKVQSKQLPPAVPLWRSASATTCRWAPAFPAAFKKTTAHHRQNTPSPPILHPPAPPPPVPFCKAERAIFTLLSPLLTLLQVWDLDSVKCNFVLGDHSGLVTAVAFSPFNAHLLATVSEDRSYKASWRCTALQRVINRERCSQRWCDLALPSLHAFQPHRPHRAPPCRHRHRAAQLWDLRDAALLYKSEILCASALTAVAFDPSVPRLAVGAADGVVRFYDVANPRGPRLLASVDLPGVLQKRAQAEGAASAAAAAEAADAPKVIGSRAPGASRRQGARFAIRS